MATKNDQLAVARLYRPLAEIDQEPLDQEEAPPPVDQARHLDQSPLRRGLDSALAAAPDVVGDEDAGADHEDQGGKTDPVVVAVVRAADVASAGDGGVQVQGGHEPDHR